MAREGGRTEKKKTYQVLTIVKAEEGRGRGAAAEVGLKKNIQGGQVSSIKRDRAMEAGEP